MYALCFLFNFFPGCAVSSIAASLTPLYDRHLFLDARDWMRQQGIPRSADGLEAAGVLAVRGMRTGAGSAFCITK